MPLLSLAKFRSRPKTCARWSTLLLLLLPLLLLGLIWIRLAGAAAVVSFSSQTSYDVGAGPYWAATFNKFGKAAIAVTNQNGNSVSVLYANYQNAQFDGTFSAATTYNLVTASVTAPAPQQVVVGNLGQTGLPCLVVAAAGANRIAVLLGNSDDSFQTTPVYYNVGNFPESVALGDVNGDGMLDIIAANYGGSTISVLLGNSDRTFQTQQTYATSPNPESIVTADFNNDGKLDVATVNSGTTPGKVNVLLNVNGTFPNRVTSDVGVNPFSLATGDFNRDGKLDIVAANHGGGVSVLLNNGSGGFPAVAPAAISAGSGPFSVAVADFNLDGQADIAVSNGDNGGSVGILPNNNGSFQALQVSDSVLTGPSPLFIAVGDFNLDGKPDIVAPDHPNPGVNPGTISVLLNTAAPFAFPPPNDSFGAAQSLNNINARSGRVNGTNLGATHDAGEPSHALSSGTASVWYSWTAPVNGAMTVDTFGSSFDTVMAVYKGTDVSALTLVGSNNNDRGTSGDFRTSSRVSFTATAGTTYKIAVDGSGVAVGNITLTWLLSPPPPNDAFAQAETITGASGSLTASNAGATKQIGEPDHAANPGGASIWYRWTPPTDGTVSISTNGSSIDTVLAVYTGSLPNLVLVVQNDNESPFSSSTASRVSFTADHTRTYFIAVDGKNGATDDINLFWGTGTVPNRSSDQAQQLVGPSGGVAGTDALGLWYKWTAPSTGGSFFSSTVFRKISGSGDSPSVVTVYTSTGQNSLTFLNSNSGVCSGFTFVSCQPARVDFNTVEGVTYYISVSGNGNGEGAFSLSWGTSTGAGLSTPLNNNFADASVITGFAGGTGGSLVGATLEPNEPNHASQQGGAGGGSVWFNWTPQQNVNVTFRSSGQCFTGSGVPLNATSIGIYTGSSVSNLTEVIKGIGSCTPSSPPNDSVAVPAVATFNALSGITYHISIEPATFEVPRSFSLSWGPNSVPLNDAFSSAQPITGQSGSVEGFTNSATSENNEPNHGLSGFFRSVWYNWTAPPTSGLVTFAIPNNASGNNVVAVYRGNTVDTLIPVVAGKIKFFAVANATYRIAVAATSAGAFTLKWGQPASITGRVKDIRGVGIANIPISLIGATPGSTLSDADGNYSFVDLIKGSNYTVTPGTNSYTFDVANVEFKPLDKDETNVDFIAETPTYSIEGQLTVNGVGIDNVTVALTGSINDSVITKAGGFYAFTDLTIKGDYKITPASSLYNFKATLFPADNFYDYKTLVRPYKFQDFTGTALPQTLNVASMNPNNGVQIMISPLDKGAHGDGPTPQTRFYDAGKIVSLKAPATAGGNNFQKWTRDGFDFSNSPETNVSMDGNYTMTAVYIPPTRKLTVASSNVPAGVNITVTPDNNSQSNGTTEFTLTYNINTKVTLTAPANSGNRTFQKWQKDGADYSTNVMTDLMMDADHTMTAVYLTTTTQTPTGQNVSVQLNGVTVNYHSVTVAGTTTILSINPASAGQLPSGYQLTNNSIAFDISTTATVVAPITVCFNVQSIDDSTVFSQLRLLHNENNTLRNRTSSQNFATKTICASVTSLSPFVLVSTTNQQLQLMMDTITQATILDAVLLLRDPFPIVNPANLFATGVDKNTRVLVFVTGLAPGVAISDIKVHLVDANGRDYDFAVENRSSVEGENYQFSQLRFRLPDELAAGLCIIEIRAPGQVSNLGTMRIQ